MKIVDYAVNGAENYAKAGKAENKTLDDTVSFIDQAVEKVNKAQEDKIDIINCQWVYEEDMGLSSSVSAAVKFKSNGEIVVSGEMYNWYKLEGNTLSFGIEGDQNETRTLIYDGENFVGTYENPRIPFIRNSSN